MTFSADLGAALSALDGLADGLEAVADGQLLDAVSDDLAVRGLELILEGFERSIAPSGLPWRALKYRTGKPLVLSGELRDDSRCEVGPYFGADGFDLTFANVNEKAAWHSMPKPRAAGWTMPTRRIIPIDDAGWSRWLDALDETGQQSLDSWLRRHFKSF